MFSKRIEAISKSLTEEQAAIISSTANRRYLTGFSSSAGTVVITREKAYFLVDFRYYEKAKQTVTSACVVLCNSLYKQLNEILHLHNIKDILIEVAQLTVSDFEALKKQLYDFKISKTGDLSNKIAKLRSIKEPTELELIKKAQSITDSAFGHILKYIKVGVTEKDIMLELEFFMRKNGSEGVAFDTIAVSGKNSSLPHGVPSDKKLENGDFLTMDFGAVYGGYCSDMTRTVAIGKISDEQIKVYNTVLKAQLAAFEMLSPNTKCSDVDRAARSVIEKAGFKGCFGHGLGHSVGLEIHESPACNTRDETLLKSGMIMTVEPGIYIENCFGVRIEDMAVITEDGFENLTHSTKELIVL